MNAFDSMFDMDGDGELNIAERALEMEFMDRVVDGDGDVKRYYPNVETQAALSEYEEMKKNPRKYKRYDSFDDLMNEVIEDA